MVYNDVRLAYGTTECLAHDDDVLRDMFLVVIHLETVPTYNRNELRN